MLYVDYSIVFWVELSLSLEQPFPDNPTFRPPPPLSDVVKSAIYERYLKTLETGKSKTRE